MYNLETVEPSATDALTGIQKSRKLIVENEFFVGSRSHHYRQSTQLIYFFAHSDDEHTVRKGTF